MTSVAQFRSDVLGEREPLKAYLGDEYGITSLEELNYESWNALFRAITRDEVAYFVKVANDQTGVFHRDIAVKELIGRAQYDSHLQGCKMLASPIPNRSGRFVNMCGALQVSVYPWIDHRPEDQSGECGAQSSESIGCGATTLVDLHQWLLRIPSTSTGEEFMPHVQSPLVWAQALPSLFHQLRRTIMVRDGADKATSHAIDWCEKRARHLVQRESEFFKAQVPGQWVHGDFRPENLVFTVSQLPIVVDWDLMHRSVAIEDVAYAGLCFSGPKWFYGARNWDAYEDFVDAYLAHQGVCGWSRRDLRVCLEWVILKLVTCSYKKEQVLSRSALLEGFDQHYLT